MRFIFTIIIPTKNRKDTLLRVLRSLEIQDFRRSAFQVIVVDDASTDGTISFLKAFKQKTKMHFTWLCGKGKGAGAARNVALGRAKGRYVLFLDADTIAESDLLRKHLQWQKSTKGTSCIIGRVSMSDQLEKNEQARVHETDFKDEVVQRRQLHWQDFRTANTSMRLKDIKQSGFFNERMKAAEDTEFAGRLSRIGMRFYYADEIHVIHHHPISYDGYFRKGAVYGQAVAQWYHNDPEHRSFVVQRYGVFARELPFAGKLKFVFRSIFINQFTVKNIAFWGRVLRPIWFALSEKLYTQVYRYHTRMAFRLTLAQIKIKSSYADFNDKLVVHAGV